MAVEVALGTPLADALNNVVQPKLVEMEWSTGGLDDSALAEYVILMLVNGKTQDQIANELATDLLSLSEGDNAAVEFSRWLFEQVQFLNNQLNGVPQQEHTTQSIPSFPDQEANRMSRRGSRQSGNSGDQDAEMADSGGGQDGALVPTGPKSMRNPRQPNRGRIIGQISKAMDRSNDSVLHRVRPQQGTERINSHSRDPPRGPRGNNNTPRNPRMMNGRPMGGMNMPGGPAGMPQNSPAGAFMNMTQQQQMQLFAMYEEQARMMSQIFSPGQGPPTMPGMPQPAINPAFQQNTPTQGGSLFERVQPNPQQRGRRPPHQNGFSKNQNQNHNRNRNQDQTPSTAMETDIASQSTDADPTSSMEVESSSQKPASGPDATCKYNLHCTNQACIYAHQSPAAPPGAPIDTSDHCPFGAACKNAKCVARHPSPAQKLAHQTEQECKYQSNCTNPKCPFRHPTMPMCRNGADCKIPGCKFTHIKMACKYNPCLNARCPFKHGEGQQRGKYVDRVWTKEQETGMDGGHVSERRFVEDENAEEELIRPVMDGVEGGGEGVAHEHDILSQGSAELVT